MAVISGPDGTEIATHPPQPPDERHRDDQPPHEVNKENNCPLLRGQLVGRRVNSSGMLPIGPLQ